MTTFSVSLTNIMALLPQSHDYSYYGSRRIPSPPPQRLQKHTGQRAHCFAHCLDSWHQARLANISCVWCWRLCGINPAVRTSDNSALPYILMTRKSAKKMYKFIWSLLTFFSDRDSSVGIATGYGLDGQGIESRLGRNFSYTFRTAMGPTQHPLQWEPGLSRG
jgi:hypothetical protein